MPTKLQLSLRGQHHQLPLGATIHSKIEDSYRDTPASELQGIITDIERGVPWREAVGVRYAERYPWLHRIITDPSRDLFFRMYPPPSGARILDIGAGWGQIALPLARAGYSVCALEPTPERLKFIQAAARQEGLLDTMWFVQADFLEVEFASRFDLVTCIGVLEWVPKFAPDLDPVEAQRRFLAKIRTLLAPQGTLIIGIENRLGLKYLLGAPDDHIGHAGITMYDGDLADAKWRAISGQPLRSRTYTRSEYEQLLTEAGYDRPSIWGAFPDYKLPTQIIPCGADLERFLATEFVEEHDGVRGAPLACQVELRSHYRSLAALGIASEFAPSFYIGASTPSTSPLHNPIG